jgi:hypothetical protein
MGVFMGPLTEIKEAFPKIDTGKTDSVSRHYVLELIETLKDEYEHFCLFSDAYDRIKPDEVPSMNPHKLATWDEDIALTRLRHSHIAEYGKLGVRASRFTEGGYCTLFREGMRARDIGGEFEATNKLIAAACTTIFEDEFGHMLEGIAGLDQEGWSANEFKLMEELVIDQLQHRVRMRNAEFSFPLSGERVQDIWLGKIDPEPFDYAAAEARLKSQAAE